MSSTPESENKFTLVEATISDAHRAIENGTVSARAMVDAYLKRIAAYDQQGPSLNAIV